MKIKWTPPTGTFSSGDRIEFRRLGSTGKEIWMAGVVDGISEKRRAYRIRVQSPIGEILVYTSEASMRTKGRPVES